MDTMLGKKTNYTYQYDNTLLQPISRSLARNNLGMLQPLSFKGFDVWNCYELSWLGKSGKPEVRVLELFIPASSEYIVESKSVKLYLNSFNHSVFENEEVVKKLIETDISGAVGAEVFARMNNLEFYHNQSLQLFAGTNLDLLDVQITEFLVNKDLLKLQSEEIIEEVLYSNLLNSKCLVTGQPDWASIQISYNGRKIDHASLLKYLLSYRKQNEFAEHCAEHIFKDLYDLIKPAKLKIYIRTTRRGGIDINPIRSSDDLNVTEINNFRHVRQ